MGIDVVARQSFFHGHYAMLDDYMYPRPVCSLQLCVLSFSVTNTDTDEQDEINGTNNFSRDTQTVYHSLLMRSLMHALPTIR